MADCPRCQHPRSPGARFCSRCGTELAEPAHGAPGGGEVDGERRHLTVMFCDLVESTALSERLDPEELRDLLAAYHETSASVVERFEGHVAQYLGDGLLVYFAYPQAHEDDAERAVRAGLAILEELAGINPRLAREHGMGVAVRIGIHTGPVVVDEAGGAQQHEAVALGYPVNLAARLQAIARPDSVVISESTLHLVQGLFVTEDLGTHTLKGVSEPIPVHRVLRPSGVRSRLDVAAAAGLSPLVGREQELSFLLENWDHAREGTGRVVLVRGEPGIGKSRLVLALRDRLADESHGWLECRGSTHREKSAFHPVIDLLRQRLELTLETSPEEQTERIERALDRAGLDREETLPLFAGLLSLEPPERYPPLGLSAEAQRRKMLESLARWLSELAAQQPTVLVVEDLHWTDPSSLELLELLIARAPTAPVLLVLTFRPTFVPPWAGRPALEEMTLHPLTRRQTTELVGAITGDRRLPSAVLDEVVKKTDGVPLFIEELTKSVLESGLLADRADGDAPADRLPELAIPSTLQNSLMARLDRLGPAKEVAQLAAV
ncbi:MAG: AAA family ATPase, partial [Myxococcota bacterium]